MEFFNWLVWFVIGNAFMIAFIISIALIVFVGYIYIPAGFVRVKKSKAYHKAYYRIHKNKR